MITRMILYFAAHAHGYAVERFWERLPPLGKFIFAVMILTVVAETLRLVVTP